MCVLCFSVYIHLAILGCGLLICIHCPHSRWSILAVNSSVDLACDSLQSARGWWVWIILLHHTEKEKGAEQWRMERDRQKERAEEVTAHFTQRTKEITGGLETRQRRAVGLSLQISRYKHERERGRTWRTISFWKIRMISAQSRDKSIRSCWVYALAERRAARGLLSLVAHVGHLKCHVSLRISHTLTVVQEPGQASVWWRQDACQMWHRPSCPFHCVTAIARIGLMNHIQWW